ncbi:MAG: ATP synthase F1 subunit gamma [Candidatus Dadabacteria bacterium]|nr:MAG: ATP synthase F1 subunit gamma [Candidatus Dadabacteria bacterium]
MAGLKEIKRRLQSVRNTRQITRAMKLVSAAKLSRAQEAAVRARLYVDALNDLMSSLLGEIGDEISHPLMEARETVKNVALLVVGGSRGLCGPFNANINKAVEEFYSSKEGVVIKTIAVGKKPVEFFKRKGIDVVSAYDALPEDPNKWPLLEISQILEGRYLEGDVDEAYLIYTKFKSVLSQQVVTKKILPFEMAIDTPSAQQGATLFEPSPKDVFDGIIPRLMRVNIHQAFLESKASEHGSRMTAMDSATKNAGELIDKLQLLHNRLRQGGITSELLDIVGGVEALNQ